MNDAFLKEKPTKIIIALYRSREAMYKSEIQDKIDTTYSHAVKTVSSLQDEGLIELDEERGRKTYVSLTSEGEELAENLMPVAVERGVVK